MSKDYTKLQTVFIELANGERLAYAGPLQVTRKMEGTAGAKVISVQFTEGKDLPEGCKFTEYEDLKVEKGG